MENPAAQMLKNISKLAGVSLGYFPQHFNSFHSILTVSLA
jgi:hypothetical protein